MSGPQEKPSEIDVLKFLEDYRKKVKEYMDPVIEMYEMLADSMGKWYKVLKDVAQRLQTLTDQYKKALTEGIDNFDPPENYDPTTVRLHPWAVELAVREGARLLDDLKTSNFSFMLDRYEKAFDGYLRQEYQLSTFTFISMIDGMIKRFCEMHKNRDCRYTRAYPTFDDGVKHLKKHYNLEIFVGKKKFEKRLRAFFEHRNEIMHGGQYANFDENISTIALLFLAVVFTATS